MNGDIVVSQTLRMRGVFVLALAASFGVACDPGLSYRIPGARIQEDRFRHYVVDSEDGIESGFSAGVFIFGGHLDVQVTNRSAGPITFDPSPTEIRDAKGGRISSECQLPATAVVVEQGHTIGISCRFRMEPKGRKFYDPESYVLMVSQPGFSKDGRKLGISAAMTACGE